MMNLIIPSSKTGFAVYPEESKAPELRRKLAVALLPFWGINGLKLWDWSGHERHCDLVGGFAAATAWVPSKMGWALNFNGTSNYIDRAVELMLTAFPFTLEAWVKFDDQYGVAVSILDHTVSNRYYAIGVDATGHPQLRARNETSETITSSDSIDDASFHQIVGVFESATVRRLYVDGVLKATDTVSITLHSNVGYFLIGLLRLASESGWWKGEISSVKMFPHVLSDGEITYLHREPFAMWELAESVSVADLPGIVYMTATAAIATTTTSSLRIGATESMSATAAIETATTAFLSKSGIVDMSATAAIATATTSSLTKWGTVLMSGTAAIVTAATATLGGGVTESMTATAAISTAVAGTLWIKGEFFNYIPTFTSGILATLQTNNRAYSNTIPIHSDSVATSTKAIQAYTNSIAIPALSEEAQAVVPRTNASGVRLYNGGYTDFTAEAKQSTPDDVDLSDGVGTKLFIGYKTVFHAVKFVVSTAGVGSYTMQAPKYWNGAAWVSGIFADGELNDFKTAENVAMAGGLSGPDDWALTIVDGTQLYWISMETLSGTQSQKPLATRIYLAIVGGSRSLWITDDSIDGFDGFF